MDSTQLHRFMSDPGSILKGLPELSSADRLEIVADTLKGYFNAHRTRYPDDDRGREALDAALTGAVLANQAASVVSWEDHVLVLGVLLKNVADTYTARPAA